MLALQGDHESEAEPVRIARYVGVGISGLKEEGHLRSVCGRAEDRANSCGQLDRWICVTCIPVDNHSF